MIPACICTGKSSSSLHNPSQLDGSKACKSCGGKIAVDGQGVLSGNMLNTMGLELPRPIDPEVKWKTTSRGRQRAVRRARTSFTGEDRMMSAIIASNGGDSPTAQGSNKAGEIPVSESEKVGVTVLGQRFSDPIESVPIKKRRFLMVRSLSPPGSSSQLDESKQILNSSCGDSSSGGKRRQGKNLASGSICLKDGKEGLLDAADFSGISILAAAACESGMEGDIPNGECSMHSGQSLKERKLEDIMRSIESNSLPNANQEKPKTVEDSHHGIEQEKSETLEDHANSFVVAELNGSDNPDESIGCTQATSEKAKRVDSSRDSRLHWDLNVAMEVWDSNCNDDMVGPEPSAAPVCESNGDANKMKELETCQHTVESKVNGDVPDLSVDRIHMVDVPKDTKTKQETDTHGDIASLPSCSGSAQKVQQVEYTSLDLKDSSAETKSFPDPQKSSYASEVESRLVSYLGCSSLAPSVEPTALTVVAEEVDISHPSVLECQCSSHLVSTVDVVGRNTVQVCELGSKVERSISKPLSEESTNLAAIRVFDKSFADHGLNDTQLGRATEQIVSEVEEQELFDVDSCSGKIDPSNIDKKAQDGSDGMFAIENAPDTSTDVKLSDPHLDNNQRSADVNELSSMVAEGANNGQNFSTNDGARRSNAKTDCLTNVVSQVSAPNLEVGSRPAIINTDGAVGLEAAAKSYPNVYENKLGKVGSNDCLDRCYDSDASHIGTDQAVGMEKVDLEDDDSQYEDGELRESDHHYWGEDGFDEVETEHVDYEGSDYKDNEVVSDIPSVSVPIDSMAHKSAGLSVASNEGIQSGEKDSDVAVMPTSLKCSSLNNHLDAGSGRSAETASEKIRNGHLRIKDESRGYEVDASILVGSTAADSRFQKGGDDSRNYPSRMKCTGWDRLPGSARASQHGDGLDSINRGDTTTLDAARGGDSSRQMRLSSNRDTQSRIERPRSFDGSRGNDQSYDKTCRSDDGYRSGTRAERMGSRRSLGRAGTSRHSQVGDRGEQWVETPNCSGSTHRRSPDYYGYGPTGPMNAAEVAVAKMESNGFVVAPDGTLVKAVGAATAGRVPRRSGNTSLHSSHRALSGRGSPIERDVCGISRGPVRAREASPDRHFGVGRNRSGRYGPEMDKDRFHRLVPDGSMNSAHHSLSRRQRSFSPHRALLHLSRSHTRSPSRSRSRSPRLWTSPRGRGDIRTNGGSSLRRHSRSPPNYRAEVRMDRMTSPHRRPAFEDRMIRYIPSSRNHNFSVHASRWVDERKCSQVDFRDHNYKRYSGRSPPLRISSRSNRFDLMDSPGRSRPEEFYRPMHSSRFPSYGFERGNRHDGNGDDRRGYDDRYETLHSVRQYDRNGSMKQFRNDSGDGLRSHISAPKSPEFRRRGSPRSFNRGFERQLADSPRGAKEEKAPFEYARNGKDNAPYKPYEIQDCDEDAAVQTKPS